MVLVVTLTFQQKVTVVMKRAWFWHSGIGRDVYMVSMHARRSHWFEKCIPKRLLHSRIDYLYMYADIWSMSQISTRAWGN